MMIEHDISNKTIGMIKRHEGFRDKPYHCTAGKLTIGYGRNLDDVGISKSEATMLLYGDVVEATEYIEGIFQEYCDFSENRKSALVNMMFNLGRSRFLGFKKMIKAIKNNDWEEAADQAKDSKWYSDVKGRAVEIVGMIREG